MELAQILSVLPTGKNIIVTGGYGHLGKAITLSLAAHGANVYVLARDADQFDEAFEGVEFKQSISFVEGDISSSDSLKLAFGKVHQAAGSIDGIINNAFYARGQSPESMPRDDFNYTLDGTLSSVFDAIKLSLPYLNEQTSIVNVSSMYGVVAPDFDAYLDSPEYLNPPHYGAAKAGVIQLTKYYASYLGKRGIRVNAVSPGPFPSYAIQKNKAFMGQLKHRTLLNKYGLPKELAGIFVFLMSDSARFITGQNFSVDGGWNVR